VRLVAAPDKMRGSLDAPAFAAAIAAGARPLGFEVDEIALSDGGEGFASCFPGRTIELEATGPLGDPVMAGLRLLDDGTAVIESASAAGRSLLADPRGDEPLEASTAGVGELVLAAVGAGATRVLVGCGGTATTDGGRGARLAIEAAGGLGGATLLVATDVVTCFADAARVFAPQKGASPAQVVRLAARLEAEAVELEQRYGIDVRPLERGGAGGGLAGGLAALGAQLCSGFELLAEQVGLAKRLRTADVVVTGEGALDATTLEGKTVSSLLRLVPPEATCIVIAGRIDQAAGRALGTLVGREVDLVDLSQHFGEEASLHQTASLVEQSTREVLERLGR
jgi:glycerate kinase